MAQEHFTWVQLIPGVGHDPDKIAIATSAISSVVLIGLSFAGYAALKKAKTDAPASKFSLRAIFELLTEFIVGLADMVIGKEGRKFVPMFGSIFLFILFNNLMGVIPGMGPATSNFNLTFALGMFSFVAYTLLGLREQKHHYAKQFTGHLPLDMNPFLLIPMLILLVPIEIISHMIRPMSLGLRLMGNMEGDHTVVGVFTDIFPIGLPVPFYALGLFVSFMQAFVFTLLSMVYVSFAVAHDEHH